MCLKENDAALLTFERYFKVDGRDQTAAREYGKLLEDKGQNELALQYFEKSIDINGKTLPIHATAGIIRILMKQGLFDEAFQRIVEFHELADNAKGFFTNEYEELKGKTKAKPRRRPAQNRSR